MCVFFGYTLYKGISLEQNIGTEKVPEDDGRNAGKRVRSRRGIVIRKWNGQCMGAVAVGRVSGIDVARAREHVAQRTNE